MTTQEAIVWRLHLRSDRRRVFDFWTTDAGREKFWVERSREDGKRADLVFSGGERTTVTFLNCNRPSLIVFEYFDSLVEISLDDDGKSGTDLRLCNTGVSREEYLDVLPGWLNVLLPLKAAVDFGVDLRNHDATRTWHDRYVDQ